MNSETQSVVFDKPPKGFWTYREASKWLRDHEFNNTHDVDEKEHTYRFRQIDPKKFSRFISKKLDNGVALVIGIK